MDISLTTSASFLCCQIKCARWFKARRMPAVLALTKTRVKSTSFMVN
jgi:ribosomal protein L24E